MTKDTENKLAIHDGIAIRKTCLSYGKQYIDQADINAVVEILKSDFLTTGPQIEAFEKSVANYVGAKYAVAVSSGTAGLHMACYAAGITKGDEVIVPAMTFAATANCVVYCDGTPVFADINERNYNIDPKEIEKKITSKTKAIIPVDFTGQAVDMDEIIKIAKKNNLMIIEDSAHALGSEYKGKKIGTKADMTVFSFHPVKPITTGEGGMVVTDDEHLYKKMLLFRSHGITRDSELLTDNDGPWYYEQIELGYNYRITDIQCALGISQMKKLNSFLTRRRAIVKRYQEAFSDVAEIITPYEEDYSNSGWHLYIIKLNLDRLKVDRKEFYLALHAENIGVNVHYLPVYLHPYYMSLGYKKGLCKNTEQLYERIITLPLFPSMSDQDVEDVIRGVIKVINYYKI
nr:UDP-4-amino-4,6-dideoxy-N-acetyl-beta-L-altrosamine transaminase [uncultured Acetobacterium sp.]